MGGVHEFCFDFFDVVWDFFAEVEFFCGYFSFFSVGVLEVEVLCLPFFSFDYSHHCVYHYKLYKYFILNKNVMVKKSSNHSPFVNYWVIIAYTVTG